MTLTRYRKAIGLLVLVISTFVLAWGIWPQAAERRQVSFQPSDMRLPASSGASAAVLEDRRMALSWPATLRLGEQASLRLIVEPESPTDLPRDSAEYSNVFEAYDVIAQARLDLAGMEYRPEGEVSEALLPGKPVVFIWYVRPSHPGHAEGTVWLHLRFVPHAGGQELTKVLTAQRIDIRAKSLLGLGVYPAKLAGSLGMIVGAILSLEGLVRWIRGRMIDA